MIRGVAAAASDPAASAAARATIESGASAVDAIIAGFLAAAGDDPGGLLAPAVALVAGVGVGAGARAFDGRAVQPGSGAPRPRGFIDAAAVPDAARFAAPRSLPMLVLLHTYHGRAKLRDLARHGVAAASRRGAQRRAQLLSSVGDCGVLALRARDVEAALLAVGGAVAGGLLTAADLQGARPNEQDARGAPLTDAATVYQSPWDPAGDAAAVEAIVACDARGIVAALAYRPARTGVMIDELELMSGLDAIPVLRGVTRVAPGTPLVAPAPIALVARPPGVWMALALPGRAAIDPASLASLSSGGALETTLEEARAQSGARAAIAVIRDTRDARAVDISS